MASDVVVYVVDDDASVRKSLGRLLQLEGYEVETFGSAREFLESPPRDAVACVVLDIRMPGMSGLELQDTLRGRHQAIAVVFITGHGNAEMRQRALKAGAVDFLAKPFNADDLLDAVRRALDKAAADRESGPAPTAPC